MTNNRQPNKKIIIDILRLFSPYRKRIVIIIISIIFTSLISIFTPLIRQILIDDGIIKNDIKTVGFITLVMLLFVIVNLLFEYIEMVNSTYITQMVPFNLLKECFDKMLRLKMAYYDNTNYYKVIENIKFDISTITTIVDQSTFLILGRMFNFVGGLVGLSIISWKLSIILLIAVPIKIYITNYFTKRKTTLFKELMIKIEKSNEWLGDALANIEIIKLWNLYTHSKNAFIDVQNEEISSRRTTIYNDKINNMISNAIGLIVNIMIYLYGALLVIKGEITLGGLFAFLSYSTTLISTISLITLVKYRTAEIIPAYLRYMEFLNLDEETLADTKKVSCPNRPSKISVENVSLVVDNKTILKNISFTINKGDKVAIWGENGSGKTSIINLLLGFTSPSSGSILIDEINLKDIDIDSYRDNVRVVAQHTKLFNRSIYENIDPQNNYSEQEIIDLLKEFNIESFLQSLRRESNVKIGTNGNKLSGGEKQKLSLLRAYLKKGNILILDEPTSNYDEESKKTFDKIIKMKTNHNILIIVTHNRETLREMNKIIKISNGTVDGIVTYEEFCEATS